MRIVLSDLDKLLIDLDQYIVYLIQNDHIFYNNPEPQLQDILHTYIHRLAYYNVINWQCENISKSVNDALSLWGYRGTVVFNKLRNECIMNIDNLISDHKHSLNQVHYIPTTFGLVMDSYIVLQIKKEYSSRQSDSNTYEELGQQCIALTNSIKETLQLFNDAKIKFLKLNKKKIFI